MDSSSIMWGLLFGSIGMGYLIYGKKQRKGIALFSGIALCAFPYFISNTFLTLLMGAFFMALPYFIRF